MKVFIYAHAEHQQIAANHFFHGLARHGIDAKIKIPQEIEDCDLAVMWGYRQTNIIKRQGRVNAHILVMERGYIGDRFYWTSLGFDGLNGHAMFPTVDDGGKRWRDYFAHLVKPWRREIGTRAVVMGQVYGDASITGVDFMQWAADTVDELRLKGYEVAFRPHPKAKNVRILGAPALLGDLSETLESNDLVVTYNSNSGVDAVMNGNYTVAHDDGSMVADIANRTVHKLDQPDRTQWFRKMAYTQWSPEEIQSGAAWEALRTVILG